LPSQVLALVSVVLLLHIGAAHCVPDAYFSQAPLPSQTPVSPHVDAV
jgi:hypothetical protein